MSQYFWRNEVCMNSPTSNKKSSRLSKSIKQSHRLDAQLADRKKAKSEGVSETVTAPVLSEIEIISHPSRGCTWSRETPEPTEIVLELQLRKVEQADRKMLGKVKRAFVKAGVEAGPEAQAAFLNDLLLAKVPVLNRSSGRIARVVKDEQSIASLLLVRVPKKSA
jgi:hypothetical protein